MQAVSNGTPADFSQQLYEQLRYDDVLNKKRLVWYVKLSQSLVNRAILEKVWLLLHATQIMGILWVNMFGALYNRRSPLIPLACAVCFANSILFRRCQGELRWPSDFCAQGLLTSHLSFICCHTLSSFLPPLGYSRCTVVDFMAGPQLEQPRAVYTEFECFIVVDFVSVPCGFVCLLSMGRFPSQALHWSDQQAAFLPPHDAGSHQPVLCPDCIRACAPHHLQQLRSYARSCFVRRLL